MNNIQRLTNERNSALQELFLKNEAIIELLKYYSSDKFNWPENDYAHVRTDLLPRLQALLND